MTVNWLYAGQQTTGPQNFGLGLFLGVNVRSRSRYVCFQVGASPSWLATGCMLASIGFNSRLRLKRSYGMSCLLTNVNKSVLNHPRHDEHLQCVLKKSSELEERGWARFLTHISGRNLCNRRTGVCDVVQLDSIRCCGHGESLLLIEVDRSSMVDEGELWLQADDSLIARSMHDTLVT